MSKSWDKILLLVVALIVVGLSGLFVMKGLAFADGFVMQPAAPDNTIEETDEPQARMAKQFVDQQLVWATPGIGAGGTEVPLLVSIPIIEAKGELINILNPEAPVLRPPVTNVWLYTNNLDYLNGGVLRQDPDGDGFDSLAEWNAKTDPQDSASHPPYAEKLVMISRQAQIYMLKFSARPDSERFQIQRLPTGKWPQRDSFYMRLGDTSEDQQFRVDSFDEKRARSNIGIEVDASVLNVTYLPTEKKVQLIRNINTEIPTYFTQLEFLLDPGNQFYVKEGDSFNLLKDPETKYRVIEVKENSTVISYQTGSEPEQTVEINQN